MMYHVIMKHFFWIAITEFSFGYNIIIEFNNVQPTGRTYTGIHIHIISNIFIDYL